MQTMLFKHFNFILVFLISFNIISLFTSIALLNIFSILLSIVSIYVWFKIALDKKYKYKYILLFICALPIFIFVHEWYVSQNIAQACKALNAWRPLIYGSLWLSLFLYYPKLYIYSAWCFIICVAIFSIYGVGYYVFTGQEFGPIAYKHAPYLSTQILITGIALVWNLALNTNIHKYSAKFKYIFLLIGVCASLMVFLASARRTAYIIYAAVILFYICVHLKKMLTNKQNKFRQVFANIGLVGVLIVLCITLYFSPVAQQRIQEAKVEASNYKQQYMQNQQFVETSNGLRLRFWLVSKYIIQDNLWWGVGFSRYISSFRATETKIDDYHAKFNVTHPHNEFLHVWSCFGILGFCLYTSLLVYPILNYTRLNKAINKRLSTLSNYQNNNALSSIHFTLVAAYIACIVGTLFNAMAVDMIEGHFLACIIAAYYSLHIHVRSSSHIKILES